MNIITLQEQIYTFLKTKADRVYFMDAPKETAFPYVTYDLPSSLENIREDFILEVDVWDDEPDTKILETLVGNIDGDGDIFNPTGLHRKNIYIADSLSAKLYRESRFTIRDEDIRIKHRQLRYTVQVYL
jgi:hypothetical protein